MGVGFTPMPLCFEENIFFEKVSEIRILTYPSSSKPTRRSLLRDKNTRVVTFSET